MCVRVLVFGVGWFYGFGDSGCDFFLERFLYFAEKVLFILYGLGIDSYLVVKKY